METTIITFEGSDGSLLPDLLRARKVAFIDKRGWDLPHVRGMEYDQYDTPASVWSAIHEEGRVVAGVRLTPTDHRVGIYTYMIKDAQDGKLPGMPTELLDGAAPVDPDVWECTRVFVLDDQPIKNRLLAQRKVPEAMMNMGKFVGAKSLIAITPDNWPRWYPRFDLRAKGIGPILEMEDGNYQCVEIEVR